MAGSLGIGMDCLPARGSSRVFDCDVDFFFPFALSESKMREGMESTLVLSRAAIGGDLR
jgi:hypothetical protein